MSRKIGGKLGWGKATLSVGRLQGGRCAKATKANRKRRHCTRSSPVGKPISQRADAGRDIVTITRSALPPGQYQLTVTPSTPGHEGTPTTTTITVIG